MQDISKLPWLMQPFGSDSRAGRDVEGRESTEISSPKQGIAFEIIAYFLETWRNLW
jgi:hypothetical protein